MCIIRLGKDKKYYYSFSGGRESKGMANTPPLKTRPIIFNDYAEVAFAAYAGRRFCFQGIGKVRA